MNKPTHVYAVQVQLIVTATSQEEAIKYAIDQFVPTVNPPTTVAVKRLETQPGAPK